MEEVNITITGHSTKTFDFGVKHIVEEDRKKYEFFEKKKNGDQTKAYEGWLIQGLGVGSSARAMVEEEDAPFKGKDGNMIPWKRRKILWWVNPKAGDVAVQEHMDNRVGGDFEPSGGWSDEDNAPVDTSGTPREYTIGEKVDILWDERNG